MHSGTVFAASAGPPLAIPAGALGSGGVVQAFQADTGAPVMNVFYTGTYCSDTYGMAIQDTTLYTTCNNVSRSNPGVLFAIDLLASLSSDPSKLPNPVVPAWQVISPGGLQYPTVDSLHNVYYSNFGNTTFAVASKLSNCRRNVRGTNSTVGYWPKV